MAKKIMSGFLNLNTLLSLLDPESRKLAQAWWASLPDNSPLKGELFERVFGVFKAWAETKSKGMGPIGDIVEKLTDIADFAVRGGGSKTAKVAHGWMDRFYNEAAKRIEKAADPRAELERVKSEFELRRGLLQYIEEAKKSAEPARPAEVLIDWSKIQNQYEAFMLASAKFTAKAVNQTVKTDRKVADQLKQFANWLDS